MSRAEVAAAWALTADRVAEVKSTGEEGGDLDRAPAMYAPDCGQHLGLTEAEWYTDAGIEVLDGEPSSRSVCAQTSDGGG